MFGSKGSRLKVAAALASALALTTILVTRSSSTQALSPSVRALFSQDFDAQPVGAVTSGTTLLGSAANRFTTAVDAQRLSVTSSVSVSAPNALSVSAAGGGQAYLEKQYPAGVGYKTHNLVLELELGRDFSLPKGGQLSFAEVEDSTASSIDSVSLSVLADRTLQLRYRDHSGARYTVTSTQALTRGSFHRIELDETVGSSGALAVSLDRAKAATATAVDLGTGGATVFSVGMDNAPHSATTTGRIYLDDVATTGVRTNQVASDVGTSTSTTDHSPTSSTSLSDIANARASTPRPGSRGPTTTTPTTTTTTGGSGTGPPSSAAALAVCGTSVLHNPSTTPPAGAVVIAASLVPQDPATVEAANTTYWFAAAHYFTGKINAADNSVYEGATGAVLDGTDAGFTSAFGGQSSGVTIEYLTIQNYLMGAGSSAEDDDAVNDDLGQNWTIEYDTIQNNGRLSVLSGDGTVDSPGGGYATGLTTGDVLQYSCLTHNGQGGFNAGRPTGVNGSFGSDVTITHNEMSFAGNIASVIGNGISLNNFCGCSAGGGKFFFLENSSITDNYVHDNAGIPGIWGDTNNAGVVISGNYISHNGDSGIMYEASYNALIENNTVIDNGWARGAQNISQGGGSFPEAGGVYVADSGGDSRIAGGSQGISTLTISGNAFTDNWGGVIVWNDANRFCGPTGGGDANVCTLGPNASETACVKPGYIFTPNASNPATYSPSYSSAAGLYWDCRYNAKNVLVKDNVFSLTPANVPGCQAGSPHNTMYSGESGFANGTDGGECGFVSTVSEFASGSTCSPTSGSCTGNPYVGTDIENAVAFHENNVFSDNTYIGPWSFQAPEVGDATLSFAQWQGAPFHQDAGSTLRAS